MKSSRRITWLVFGVCALLVLEGLGYVSWRMLRLESRERALSRDAREQEILRLALWRVDSAMTPLLAGETARPYFHYRAFYPAERAYTRMWEEVLPGEVLVPSPMLHGTGDFIKLHFEIDEDGTASSPQAPSGNMRDLAESTYVSSEEVQRSAQLLEELVLMLEDGPGRRDQPRLAGGEAAHEPGALGLDAMFGAEPPAPNAPVAGERTTADFDQRMKGYSDALKQANQQVMPQTAGLLDRAVGRSQWRQLERVEAPSPAGTGDEHQERDLAHGAVASQEDAGPLTKGVDAPQVTQGPFEAMWRRDAAGTGHELVFVRRVQIDDRTIVQGFWVDWPRLREDLRGRIQDLLPSAEIEPVLDGQVIPAVASGAHSGELLASFPARLRPSIMPVSVAGTARTISVTLAVTWLAVLLAIGAIAVVLRASMAMSERRGRFVSAVTHELRTPLTTFCLYSGMLADGKVRDDTKRGEYLGTLKQESQRLARIVENVLAYARLGRRQAARARDAASVGEMLDRALPALERRAQQGGMTIDLDAARGARDCLVPADPESVERILLNLVDNACKYASEAADRRIHVGARVAGQRLRLTVSDHGPGVTWSERRRIFAPFRRARRDEDGPNPGLGLGLALARGLAQKSAGDLRLLRTRGPGATFELTLPVVG